MLGRGSYGFHKPEFIPKPAYSYIVHMIHGPGAAKKHDVVLTYRSDSGRLSATFRRSGVDGSGLWGADGVESGIICGVLKTEVLLYLRVGCSVDDRHLMHCGGVPVGFLTSQPANDNTE